MNPLIELIRALCDEASMHHAHWAWLVLKPGGEKFRVKKAEYFGEVRAYERLIAILRVAEREAKDESSAPLIGG